MKKILVVLFLSIFIIIGCENIVNSPTGVVENYFSNYQKLDKNVIKDLEDTIKKEENMNKEQKEEYKNIIEKQYQNLSYKITNEEVFKKNAVVDVEIEVLDYKTAIYKSTKYFEEHKDQFNEKKEKFIDYKIKKLKEVNDKTKYKLTLNLTNNEGIWTIDELSDIDKQKIHGLY